jgi:hypothetical protein
MAALTVTATQVLPGAAADTIPPVFETAIAGAAITAGQPVYLDAAGLYQPADSDSSALTATVVGMALNGAAAGQPVRVQTAGDVTMGAGAAPAVGTLYCVGPTAGDVVPVADLANPSRVSLIGVGIAGNKIRLRPWATGQVVPA